MIEHDFNYKPNIPFELGAKKKKDKSKAKNWNQQKAGTSKAKMGVERVLIQKTGKQSFKHH
ncbi:MAG: hypothetical protein A2798_01090 [Candidatus Levybacteria bacterium RIFCSPHIGHO2_01_FULL_37_17]|nr:MAG: hypothetical protein A2798_01090 [Candidatus Levybacteria bacterium RIFCSPHIGHO2_01_FULL_37_17]OGH37047.1 MAG: hypothetical protein A2959_01950 [Candidatus Levybacteria bacterium RIFCSPLOWO2_01_FULL_38_23]